MKKNELQPRTARFNRFQTSVSGLTYVSTVMNAHFDPYAEPAARPNLSRQQMETVARVEVGETSGPA